MKKLIKKLTEPWRLQERINLLNAQQEDLLRRHEQLLKRYNALIAIDWHFHESGKLILLTKVNGRDRVKIFNIDPSMSSQAYGELVFGIEQKYGVKLTHFDAPPRVKDDFLKFLGR